MVLIVLFMYEWVLNRNVYFICGRCSIWCQHLRAASMYSTTSFGSTMHKESLEYHLLCFGDWWIFIFYSKYWTKLLALVVLLMLCYNDQEFFACMVIPITFSFHIFEPMVSDNLDTFAYINLVGTSIHLQLFLCWEIDLCLVIIIFIFLVAGVETGPVRDLESWQIGWRDNLRLLLLTGTKHAFDCSSDGSERIAEALFDFENERKLRELPCQSD